MEKDFTSNQEYSTSFGDENSPLFIFPMTEDKGFKKHGICNYHYWNINQSKCLRCGLEVVYQNTETHSSVEFSITIPLKLKK